MIVDPNKVVTSTGERTWKAGSRFKNPYDLHSRYLRVKAKYDEVSNDAEKIIALYERKPHKKKISGTIISEPNWGKFRQSVDDCIKFFSTIALDREVWCRVETYEGEVEEKSTYYSDCITQAFHKYCIKPWHDKDAEVIKCISDDCLFNKGVMHWHNQIDTYPTHIPTEYAMPDTNATTCVDSFDILFVRDKITAVELFQMTDSSGKELGWNKKAILTALAHNLESLKNTEADSIIERFRRGGVSQEDSDRLISIVYCYVKEYNSGEISLLIIPEDLCGLGVSNSSNSLTNSDATKLMNLKRNDYLRYVPNYADSFSEVISLWTSNIERAFYNSKSFAWQIYLGCKFYDQTMNSIINQTLDAANP
jgi:hypothetical protein